MTNARTAALDEAFGICVAMLIALAVGSLLILVYGESPASVYGELVAATWGDATGRGDVIFKATPLVFTGLAVSVALRAGLFNIGGEGQLTAGAFATAIVGAALPDQVPAVLALPLSIASGMAAGAMLGGLAGVLKARFGAHEVINTIMLNFIVGGFVLWLGNRWLFVGESVHTTAVAPSAWLPSLGLGGSAANVSALLAVISAGAVWYWQARTRTGFELRAMGLSVGAARAAGIRIGRSVVVAMAVSGGLAGLVGTNFVLGHDNHYFEQGVGRGMGFMGIAVALLGRNHPLGLVLAAVMLGTLSAGGLAVGERVPKELFDVLQAVIILSIAASSAHVRGVAARAVAAVARSNSARRAP